jgi:signal transduction histidine kinase
MSEHIVQFYDSDEFLATTVANYVGDAIRAGEGAIVVATPPHRLQIEELLRADDLNLPTVEARGQCVALDAGELLATFLIDEMPDARRFADVVGGLVSRVARQYEKVRVFGEMVGLLATEGNHAATIRLEQLWNDLRKVRSFSLLCAYPMHRLGNAAFAAALAQVCAEHSAVVPAEGYSSLVHPDERLSEIALLQQKARWLEAEIAERTRAEEQLRSTLEAERLARQVAEEALRTRDEFLAVAAHELKTPLTTLIGQAQLTNRRLAHDGSCEPARITRSLQTIVRQGEALSLRINQILIISQLDEGRLILEREPVDLVPFLHRTVLRIASDQHTIRIETPLQLVAWVDPPCFEQVLFSLLDNAVRYSPGGGAIDVVLTAADSGYVELSVRDHGLGIPLDKRESLFDRYAAAHGEDYRSGMGLGLYVSRRLVELHGGEVRAEFPLNGGTRFLVRLPVENGIGETVAAREA